MKLRHPPGRGGRLWLAHRIDVATRGADLLDKKRRALVQEQRRLRVLAGETEVAWAQAARDAETWAHRLAVLAGQEKLRLLSATHPVAEVIVRWRSSMGVAFASEARIEVGTPMLTTTGGSAAADMAVPAARRAVQAAVNDAVAQSALKRVAAEVTITSRRHRALERRWLPALAEAAAQLSESLDELEREEATRTLWITRTRGRSGR